MKEQAIIEFSFMVQGTPPKVEDKWVILKKTHKNFIKNFFKKSW